MRYLLHVEQAIARLGYVRPEYAAALAIIMEEHEGQHPNQIARLFRQHGTPLTSDEKRAIKVRANSDLTREALDALTDKGRGDPLKGLDSTLVDASFSFFRARNVNGALQAGYDRFAVDGMFSADCAGCARLHGQIVTSAFLAELPPHDCQREACAIGLQVRIDFIQELVDAELAVDGRRKKAAINRSPSGGFWARLFGRGA